MSPKEIHRHPHISQIHSTSLHVGFQPAHPSTSAASNSNWMSDKWLWCLSKTCRWPWPLLCVIILCACLFLFSHPPPPVCSLSLLFPPVDFFFPYKQFQSLLSICHSGSRKLCFPWLAGTQLPVWTDWPILCSFSLLTAPLHRRLSGVRSRISSSLVGHDQKRTSRDRDYCWSTYFKQKN